MAKFQKISKNILSKLSNLTGVYKEEIGSTYDVASMTNTPAYTEYPIACCRTKVTNGDIQAGIASATDLTILVSGLDLVGAIPKEGDLITIGSDTYQVNVVLPFDEALGVKAFYKFICKAR